MKKHFFKTFEFEFETTRLLWYIPAGGADYGEVVTVTEKIKDGDYESWHNEWQNCAENLTQRAENFVRQQLFENAANAFLRASRYYQAAEFFLDPSDTRKYAVYQKSVNLFYRALDLKKINYQLHEIPYSTAKLRSLYFPSEKEVNGTFIICGGFDALLEELYFTNVTAALENGYDVILYEGPGQSKVIREYQLPFEKNWQNVAKILLDFYEEKQGIRQPKIAVGISLGGLLVARAASFEQKLFNQIVLYNYFPSMLESFKHSLPAFLHRFLEKGFPTFFEKIASLYISKNKFLNWQVEHAKWVFGAGSLNDLLKITAEFNENIAYQKLETDCLIFLAESENYYDYHLGLEFYEKIPAKNKQLILFNKENHSSNLHCQNGAAYESNEEIFSWLESLADS